MLNIAENKQTNRQQFHRYQISDLVLQKFFLSAARLQSHHKDLVYFLNIAFPGISGTRYCWLILGKRFVSLITHYNTEETLAKSSWNQREKKFVENEIIFLFLNEHVNYQFQKMR